MIRRFLLISCIFILKLIAFTPGNGFTQEASDTTILPQDNSPADSVPDSLPTYSLKNDSDQTETDTLFFLNKPSPYSLFDSTVINNRFVPDSITRRMKTDDRFWYANAEIPLERESEKSSSFGEKFLQALGILLGSPIFRQLLWLLMIILFSVALIWFLIQNKMNIFSRGKSAALFRQTQEDAMEDITSESLKEAIAKAVSQRDYRMAIRFSYLQLLKIFSHHGFIHFAADTTNQEILNELYIQPFYHEFFQITRSYEYVWYGMIPVNKDNFEQLQHDFSSLYQKAGVSV